MNIGGRDLSAWKLLDILSFVFFNLSKLGRGLLVYHSLSLVGLFTTIKGLRVRFGYKIGRFCKISGKPGAIRIGKAFSLGDFSIIEVSKSYLETKGFVSIGDNCGFGEYTYINGVGGVQIGDNVIAGQFLSLHPQNHEFLGNEFELYRLLPTTERGIRIGNNVWFGAKVTILDGSVIGDGCIIAAGSVVRGVFDNYTLIAGVPAVEKRRLL